MFRCFILFVCAVSLCFSPASQALAQEQGKKALTVRGASTVANLIQPWVAEYESSRPGVRVVVTASSQGVGFEALLGGTADLCMTARKVNGNERSLAGEKGIRLEESQLMNDAVAIIVNKNNPVDALSIDKLAKAFSGELLNWNQLGGPDEVIDVITLPEASAMTSFLGKDVFKITFYPKATVLNSPRDVPTYVRSKRGGLGFCRTDLALNTSTGVKTLALKKTDDSPPVPLKTETIKDGSYPIMRPLGFCWDQKKQDKTLLDFVDFCAKKAQSPEN